MIGNLVADKQESITSINWSVYGKIRGIIKRNTTRGIWNKKSGRENSQCNGVSKLSTPPLNGQCNMSVPFLVRKPVPDFINKLTFGGIGANSFLLQFSYPFEYSF
jgi:hypothetical protein